MPMAAQLPVGPGRRARAAPAEGAPWTSHASSVSYPSYPKGKTRQGSPPPPPPARRTRASRRPPPHSLPSWCLPAFYVTSQ
eukprot:9311805-Alexandrium_andersonii.AAC.1